MLLLKPTKLLSYIIVYEYCVYTENKAKRYNNKWTSLRTMVVYVVYVFCVTNRSFEWWCFCHIWVISGWLFEWLSVDTGCMECVAINNNNKNAWRQCDKDGQSTQPKFELLRMDYWNSIHFGNDAFAMQYSN